MTGSRSTPSGRSLKTFHPERYSDLVPQRGGRIGNMTLTGTSQKLTKLLMKVNIERSIGAVHIVMRVDDTVRDLIKAAIEIYVKEKRRPLLKDRNPYGYELHCTQFSLESLNAEEKLINLGTRNFFMRSNPSSVKRFSSTEPQLFPFIQFMDFVL